MVGGSKVCGSPELRRLLRASFAMEDSDVPPLNLPEEEARWERDRDETWKGSGRVFTPRKAVSQVQESPK